MRQRPKTQSGERQRRATAPPTTRAPPAVGPQEPLPHSCCSCEHSGPLTLRAGAVCQERQHAQQQRAAALLCEARHACRVGESGGRLAGEAGGGCSGLQRVRPLELATLAFRRCEAAVRRFGQRWAVAGASRHAATASVSDCLTGSAALLKFRTCLLVSMWGKMGNWYSR